MTQERVSYRFGPLERRTLLGPVRAGQAGVAAGAAILAVVVLDHAPDGPGVMIAVALVALAAAACTIPVAGRTLEQWLPVAAMFAATRGSGGARFRSGAPTRGIRHVPGPDAITASADPKVELPASLRGLELTSITDGDHAIGAISQLRGKRLTAVLACRTLSFALLDPEAQERRLSQWGVLLSSLSGTPVRRVQWVQRTAPARGDELAQWLHSARDPALPLRGEPIVESYLELIGTGTRIAREHEVLLAIQVDCGRLRGRPADSAHTVLIEQADRMARALRDAGVAVLGALSVGQLAHAMRTAFDPYARVELAALEAVDRERDGPPPSSAAPLGCDEAWDHYRCDGALHATFWIGAWPRTDVSPMFMNALLGDCATVRTVAVTFEPIEPDRSIREVEAAITRDRADVDLRRRFGQVETARHRQAQEAAQRREAELTAGHCEVRLAGFVTVSGRDRAELEHACEETHQQAARARLELHRMYGQQAQAFTFTLPLASGLR